MILNEFFNLPQVFEKDMDAYDRDVANSTSGFGKDSQAYRADGGANDERHDLDQQSNTWYIRLNGKLIRDKAGDPYSFQSKAAANKAALTMQAKLFNKDKEFMLTTNPNDKVAEIVDYDTLNQLASHPMAGPLVAAGGAAIGGAIGGGIKKTVDYFQKRKEQKAQARRLGQQGMAEGENLSEDYDDGMYPVDLSSNPSFKQLVNRYTQLFYQGHEGTYDDEEAAESDAIEEYVAKRFGQKGSDHLLKAAQASYGGRDDGKGQGHLRGDNLGWPSMPVGNFRTTSKGKMHKQDVGSKKQIIGNRLGQHPKPTLPEGEDYSPVTGAITRRIITQHPEVLAKYGPAVVSQAIDEIADFVGDVDEIGSSDVSGWVSQVIRSLARFAPVRDESVAEGEPGDLEHELEKQDYQRRQQRDYDAEKDLNKKDLSELSPGTLASYKNKAGADATAADKRGDIARGNKRFSGIVKATIKQGEQDAKQHPKQSVRENRQALLKRIIQS